jgi:diacylglycerol kinase family enzyme
MLETIDPKTEFIAIAGGDGTIRKTVMRLLDKKLKYKRPIALLPFGTANNIATSLEIPEDNAKNISSWASYNLKKFDVGQVVGTEETAYFIEAFGLGIFPRLMKELKKMDTTHIRTPEQEFELALSELLKIVQNYEGIRYEIDIDGEKIDGTAILIEVMNISSLGPHLKLSEKADAGDGYFDVVVVNEDQRSELSAYVSKKCALEEPAFPIKPIKVKNLKIYWEGKDVHVDDEVLKTSQPITFDVSLLDSLLEIVTANTPTR